MADNMQCLRRGSAHLEKIGLSVVPEWWKHLPSSSNSTVAAPREKSIVPLCISRWEMGDGGCCYSHILVLSSYSPQHGFHILTSSVHGHLCYTEWQHFTTEACHESPPVPSSFCCVCKKKDESISQHASRKPFPSVAYGVGFVGNRQQDDC